MPNQTLNKVLTGLFIILLSFFTFSFITYKNISTVPAMEGFLKNSNSYVTLSQIIQTQIKNNYPPQITINPLRIAIANYLVNAIVQPDSVETLTSYALPAAQKIAQQPTSILNDQVVIDTTGYKQQLASDLSGTNLPPIVISTAQNVVQGIPDSLALVDLNQHPNSIMAKIISFRTFLENLSRTLTQTAVLLGLTFLGLIFINRHYLSRLLWALVWGFAGTALLILIIGFIAPYLLNPFTQSADQLDILYNNLAIGMINYLASLANKWAILYGLLALGSYLLLRYAPIEDAQNWIDEKLPDSHPQAETKSTKDRKKSKISLD
jgi:hypothetical protein